MVTVVIRIHLIARTFSLEDVLFSFLTRGNWWIQIKASGAVQRSLASGKKRQKLQLLLPVDQRQFNYLDTEPR